MGDFKNGTLNGRGISFFINGDNYEGEYKNGKRNGEGIYTFANGDNYKGGFKNGKRHGEGVLTFSSGAKPKEGVWKDGKFLYSKLINKQSKQKTILSLEFQKEKQKRIKLQRKVNEEELKR